MAMLVPEEGGIDGLVTNLKRLAEDRYHESVVAFNFKLNFY